MEKNIEKKKSKFNTILILFSLFIFIISIIIYFIFFKKSKKNNNSHPNILDELNVSIDFGNYKSSYAYKFGKSNKIIYGQKRSVPSIVILNKDNLKGKNFGQKSISSIANYDENEMCKIIYKNNLKLLLNNITNITNGEQYLIDSKAVIEYLKLFSDEIMEEINSYGYKYNKENINWIITAPRIWDDYSKMNLINFAKEAGMYNAKLALESEVASLSIFNDKILDEKLKKNGKIFLLIDLGDYTIDITLNEIVKDNRIKILSMPMGESLGSMNINNDLMEIIENIFGKDVINKAKESQFDEYLQLLKDLDDLKKKYKKNSTEYYEVYAKFERKKSFTDKIKHSFKHFINYIMRKKNYDIYIYDNCTIKIDENKIFLPDELIGKIIQKRVSEIINYIKFKINIRKKYDYIILTGGYSNNGILIEEFRKNFKNVHILSNQEYSVLEGSLNYFNNKKRIYSIVSYNTYGIKYKDEIKTLIKKGDVIKYNFSVNNIINLNKTDYLCIEFYKSLIDKLSDDDYFGTLKIDLREYYKDEKEIISLKLIIRFNTHLQIDVHDSINEKKINFSFIKRKCINYPDISHK